MLRIYSYYLPIWVCSVLSAVIYFAVGYHVFHMRNQLRNLSLSNQGKEATYDSTDVRDSAEKVCDLCFLGLILPTTDPSCQPPLFICVFFEFYPSAWFENKAWSFLYHLTRPACRLAQSGVMRIIKECIGSLVLCEKLLLASGSCNNGWDDDVSRHNDRHSHCCALDGSRALLSVQHDRLGGVVATSRSNRVLIRTS